MVAHHSGTRQTNKKPNPRWRVADIVVASVIAVAVGVIFWIWSQGYTVIAAVTTIFPPLAGLYTGGWLIAGVLGGLLIRKPGAAVYCELIAAAVEGLLGTHFGMTVIISGLIQGFAAELAFAAFRYRRWTLPVVLLAGLFSGIALGVNENFLYNAEWTVEWKLVYVTLTAVSGVVIAGLLSWFGFKGLRQTGVLSGLASGRAASRI